eukprot:scaffold762_cov363-Pavlova_lutheri.AAC.39
MRVTLDRVGIIPEPETGFLRFFAQVHVGHQPVGKNFAHFSFPNLSRDGFVFQGNRGDPRTSLLGSSR